jgi:hypothetical protein
VAVSAGSGAALSPKCRVLLYAEGVKLHREQTGLGLREAKDAVEAYIAGRG